MTDVALSIIELATAKLCVESVAFKIVLATTAAASPTARASAEFTRIWRLLFVESCAMTPLAPEVRPAPTGTLNAPATVDPLISSVIDAAPVLTPALSTSVPVVVGKLITPVLVTDAMTGVEEKVWTAVHDCARFNSAMVPVLAGKLAVTAPRAPVTGDSVTVPEVALPIVSVPSVPLAPKVGVAVNAPVVPFGICPAAPVSEIAPAALTATGAVPEIAPPFVVVAHVAQAMVPVLVIVPPVIGPVVAMLVTVPPPAGVAHVPSPRQKVDELAAVPEFRLVTGRFPDTSVVKTTAPNDGLPAALPCKTVTVVPWLAN